MVLASSRETGSTLERTPLTRRTPRKSQRILVMERDVNQLLQDAERVIKGNLEGQYRPMFDALMRKTKELRDAMRSAGGSQYVDMQNMQALVVEAKNGVDG